MFDFFLFAAQIFFGVLLLCFSAMFIFSTYLFMRKQWKARDK